MKRSKEDARSTTERNIHAISAMEREALGQRSQGARSIDSLVAKAGQVWVAVFHAVLFSGWILLNLGPAFLRFDPFPFPVLSLVVALESFFLVLVVLISQNRANFHAEDRNHLGLQINLLAEHENTKMIQMLKALCAHHGLSISKDPEVAELATRTEPDEVLQQLKSNLPRIP